MFERYKPDLDAYVRRVRSGPCFVCGIVSRDPAFPDHHIVYEDEGAIVFLAMNPTQYGYTLVAPKEHRVQVAEDFTVEEYLGLQRVVHRVAEAVRWRRRPSGCTFSRSAPTRVTPTSTGMSYLCHQIPLTQSSNSPLSCSRPRAR